MKLSKSKPKSSVTFNMTPMIDIVFLLIIFFMTVSQITRTVDIPLPLPRVTQGDVETRTSTITINLNAEGTILITGQPLSLKSAMKAIESRLNKSGNDHRKVKIQLRCDRNCECRHVSELLKSLANIGFLNVRSAVSDV